MYSFICQICLCQQAKRKKKEEAANAKILEAEKRIKVGLFVFSCSIWFTDNSVWAVYLGLIHRLFLLNITCVY